MLDEIRQLYAYNRWANRRYLDAVAALNDDEFTRDMGSSFPSVGATLAHVLAAEWIWLQRWRGVSPREFPRDWDTATSVALTSRWKSVEADQRAFLADLSEPALAVVVEYRNLAGAALAGPLWQLMRHVVNHSTYHRGQVATMLRQLGHAPPNTDLIAWFREQPTQTGG